MAGLAIVLILIAFFGLKSNNVICLLVGLVAFIFVCFAFGTVGIIGFILVALLLWFVSHA